jgi:selenocysteine-specific elongation factor
LAQPERPLQHNTEVSLHTGSAEVIARVRLLEKKEALPGETTWVQFILDEPLAAANGDHYVIRSPNETIGGGIILDAHPKQRYRRFRPEIITNLKARSEGKIEETLLTALKSKQPQELDKLVSESGVNPELALSGIESLMQQGMAVGIGEGKNALFFTESDWKQTVDNIIIMVGDYHRKFPLRPGIPKAEISNKLKLGKHFQDALQKLTSEGLLVESSSLVSLRGHQVKLLPAQQLQIDTYLRHLNLNPYSPTPDIAIEPDVINLLVYQGTVIKTVSGVIFSTTAFNEMVSKVLAHIKKNGKITVAEARDLLGSSRKYVLALLEHMDEIKLTKRVGDERVAGEKG